MKITPTYMLFTYRNTIGDVKPPIYTYWLEKAEDNPNTAWIMITLMWLIWFLNQWIVVIIIFNLMIAIISQTYERITS